MKKQPLAKKKKKTKQKKNNQKTTGKSGSSEAQWGVAIRFFQSTENHTNIYQNTKENNSAAEHHYKIKLWHNQKNYPWSDNQVKSLTLLDFFHLSASRKPSKSCYTRQVVLDFKSVMPVVISCDCQRNRLRTANCTRLPTIATCSDNYHNLKLTKDCVIWRVIMNHKDTGLFCQNQQAEKEEKSLEKNVWNRETHEWTDR